MSIRSRRSFEEEITILSVGKPWSMADDTNKTYNAGCTMWYLNTPDVYEKDYDEDTGAVGYTPIKQTMAPEFYEHVKAVGLPAKAIGTFVQRNKGTGMVLVLSGIKLLDDVSSSDAGSTFSAKEEEPEKIESDKKKK